MHIIHWPSVLLSWTFHDLTLQQQPDYPAAMMHVSGWERVTGPSCRRSEWKSAVFLSTCGTLESDCRCEVSKRAGDKMCGFHANRTESRLHARGDGWISYKGRHMANLGTYSNLLLRQTWEWWVVIAVRKDTHTLSSILEPYLSTLPCLFCS